ncbi:endonuclease [Candidatus Shapirobacteria bacterium CG09_land_8_20_14_0_10_38_17]|uniref:Endonuclease n=1 Tax=Candidatus Shapirobacteria bacterium CG09_land_8_20_14_0_10_38_17 TaxID=1974884 RepID=A0A2H0WRJ1_9BACT|nr:MAG: endonuclease [Candidatus Shapirobacteria bacterium CG09_land_8_20_14_0_10_38_17]
MYYVYVIKSQSSGKIYIGQTSDLEKRLKRHNKIINIKKTSYTYKNKGPWILVYKEIFSERKDATKREKQLKSAQGRKFIKEYICTHSSVGRASAS